MVDLSIVIPCYNEEKRLPDTLRDIEKYLALTNKSVEVIVVDDGSQDRTGLVAKEEVAYIPGLRVLRYEQNQGKGYAVKFGMLAAKGRYALFMDADNSTPLSEIEKLWPYAETHEVVIGSRHLKTSNVVIKQPWYRVVISRLGNALIQAILIRGVYDTQCGFKLFQKEARQNIFSRQRTMGFGFDVEVLAIAQRVFDYRIKEVPVSWYNSTDSRVRPIYDAWRTLRELVRIKYNLLTGKYARTL